MPGSRSLNVEVVGPEREDDSAGGAVAGGATRTFTSPFGGDAVLYLVDAAVIAKNSIFNKTLGRKMIDLSFGPTFRSE